MTKSTMKFMMMVLALASGIALTAASASANNTIPIPGGGHKFKIPRPKPVGEITIRGLKYADHTANTSLSTNQVNAGDFFQITTLSLFYGYTAGALPRTIKVVLQDASAPSAISGGYTGVYELTNVWPQGQTLTVQSPTLPMLRNRTYHVTVFVYVADGTRHYASAGTLTVH